MRTGRGLAVAVLSTLSLLGCSSASDSAKEPDTEEETSATESAGDDGAEDAAGDEEEQAAGGEEEEEEVDDGLPMATVPSTENRDLDEDAFAACVDDLQPMCSYQDKEVACSSIMTPVMPLTDGGTWGDIEIVGGPYGAFVDWNQGAEFKNEPNFAEGTCSILVSTFGEPDEVNDDILDLRGGDLSLYTIFRPACMKEGEKYPVITWGNGTCGQTGGYASLLAALASHGFVVFASNSRFTGAGLKEMSRALDFAEALNADENSHLYNKLDMDKVGAMGHSQGAGATVEAAADERVKSLILWNGPAVADKPFLAVTGDRDINDPTPGSLKSEVEGSDVPGAWLFYHKVLETGGNVTGHLTLMQQPERVWEVTVAWWKYMLNGDEEAGKMFLGEDCGLCGQDEDFEFGINAAFGEQ